jgi:hypothetical protein
MRSTAGFSVVRTSAIAAWLAGTVFLAGCASSGAIGPTARTAREHPGMTVRETLTRAVALLEASQCATFAVNFLSPIKLAQIKDLDAYRKQRDCSPADRGNVDEVLLALRLALGAEPVVQGVKATIDLSGIGIRISKFEFVKYLDGRWYFNEL